jgi:hypothetical protein
VEDSHPHVLHLSQISLERVLQSVLEFNELWELQNRVSIGERSSLGQRTCEYFSALKARTTYSEVYGRIRISVREYEYAYANLRRIRDVDLT